MFKVNDVVRFKGTAHYVDVNSNEFKPCKPGIVKIDIVTDSSNLNPIHIIAEPFGKSDAYGYVKLNDLEPISDNELLDFAITKLAGLNVINSPDYWKTFVNSKEVLGLDTLFIKSFRYISECKERMSNPYESIEKMTNVGIVTLPEYWNEMASKYPNIGYLMNALAGSVDKKEEIVFGTKVEGNREEELRSLVVETAQSYLGYNEWDGSHRIIIDGYNAHKPLACNYFVKYTDSWCDTFVSFISIKLGLTDIIPTECGCERHIELFKELGVWQEDDNYLPKKGDIIFYNWDDNAYDYSYTDNKMYADHVGIVVSIDSNSDILVIEGNYSDMVKYRNIVRNGRYIRGYAVPRYDKHKG